MAGLFGGYKLRQYGGSRSNKYRLYKGTTHHVPVAVPLLHSGTLHPICTGSACPGGGEQLGGCHLTQHAVRFSLPGTRGHQQTPAHATQLAGPSCGTTTGLDLHCLDTTV